MVLSFGSDVLSLKKIKSEVKGSVKKQFYFDLKVKGKEKDNKDYMEIYTFCFCPFTKKHLIRGVLI